MEEVSGREGEEKKGQDRKGKRAERREEGRKEREGKEGELSQFFFSGLPSTQPNGFPSCNGPRGCCSLGPAIHCWLFLSTVFGFHKGHCSPFGFSGPDVRQDLLINVPYPSRDQSIIFKQRCLKTPE